MSIYNRVCGMLFGHALGDALGAPFENSKPHNKKYTGKLDTHIIRAMGYQNSVIGQITDDTEMSLALIRTIKKGYTCDKAIKEYILWANGPVEFTKNNKPKKSKPAGYRCPFMGTNTKLLLKDKYSLEDYQKQYNEMLNKSLDIKKGKHIVKSIPLNKQQSNGAMMRAYPLAVLDENYTKMDVYITNPNLFTVSCTIIYVNAIRDALNGKTKKEINNNIVSYIKSIEDSKVKKQIYYIFDRAFNKKKLFDSKTENDIFEFDTKKIKDLNNRIIRGWTGSSFYCAFYGFFNYNNYSEMINELILFGGDSDTNAAIAGALFGAFYGMLKLCSEEITKENMKILIRANPNTGYVPNGKKRILRLEFNHFNPDLIFGDDGYVMTLYKKFIER